MKVSMEDTRDIEKEALNFLEQDFNQSFQQMRFYDSQIFEILKFMFSAYTILIGASVSLYQLGITKNINFSVPIASAIGVGLVFGLFMFIVIVRNRVYFVQVARYINELRNFFFEFKPLGFNNKCKMYTNYEQPPYFNWRSSQLWLCYIVATLNSILFAVLLYVVYSYMWNIAIYGFLMLFIFQLFSAIWYLKSREGKSASKAVFGEE